MRDFYPNGRGPLLRRLGSRDSFLNRPMEWLYASPEVEVYFVPDIGYTTDPEFLMATNDGVLVTFAYTGDMTSVHKLVEGSGKPSLETIVKMDPQHHFWLNRSSLPVDGIADDPHLADEQILESIVHYAYERAKAVKPSRKIDMARHFHVLTYDAIVARFNLLQTMQSSTDIIPDQSPRTIFVKAGDGCMLKCNYCPEGLVNFKPYTINQFVARIKATKRALSEILGDKIERMNEGFINVSDIGWLDFSYRAGRTDLTSIRVAELMREYFPWLEKIGSFIGSTTALKLSEGDKEFFSRLRDNSRLVNRLYLGVETADTEGSYLLNKRISYEEKLAAAHLIQNAGIRLKVIVQLGVLGQGFYPLSKEISSENFVPSERAIDTTARWVNAVQPYRVLESVFQPSYNVPILRLIEEGRIIPYANPAEIEIEKQRFRSQLRLTDNRSRVDPDYEQFLPPPDVPRGRGRLVYTLRK